MSRVWVAARAAARLFCGGRVYPQSSTSTEFRKIVVIICLPLLLGKRPSRQATPPNRQRKDRPLQRRVDHGEHDGAKEGRWKSLL